MPPDPMTGFNPRPWDPHRGPLYSVCRKGVNNLLNHTLPVPGTSGSTNQVRGLLEQDSIYNRLRRFKNFLQWLAQYISLVEDNRVTTWHVPTCPH